GRSTGGQGGGAGADRDRVPAGVARVYADAASVGRRQRDARRPFEHAHVVVDRGERGEIARDAAAGRAAAGVHDAAARVAALQSERQRAAAVGIEVDSELLELADARRRVVAEDPRRAL